MDKTGRNVTSCLFILGSPYIRERTDLVGLIASYTLGGRSFLHPYLRFTFKKEYNCPLLDVLVGKNEAESITSVYRKPTFTGQYLRRNSFCLSKRKINLINTLVHRVLMICSNSKLQSELDNIRSIILKNGYPNLVVNSAITLKLKNFNRPVKFGPSKCLVYLDLSWFGTVSTGFEKQIRSSVCRYYFAVESRVVFTTSQLLTATKNDVLPAFQHSNIIYQYLCGLRSPVRRSYIPKVVGQDQTACTKEHQNWPVFSRSIGPFLFLQIFQLFSFP